MNRISSFTILPLFLSAFLSIGSTPALGEDSGILETRAAIIQYDEGLIGVARKIASAVPDISLKIEKELGWALRYRPIIRIIGKRGDFQALGAGRHTVAFAAGQRGLIVIDNTRIRQEPTSLIPTVTHEWIHLVLHHHIPPGNLPRWLSEGLAQRAGGGTGEILSMEGTGYRLQQAVLTGRWVSFRDISVSFPNEDPDLSLAYEQSRSFVNYLVERFEREGLLRILSGLREGKPVDQATREAVLVSFSVLEADWRAGLTRQVTWVSYLSNNLPYILMLGAAGLTILGFIRLRVQRNRYKDDENFL